MVAMLIKPGDEILPVLSARDVELLHAVIGIAGEAGELLDAIKKTVIYRKEIDRENVIEELGDLAFYVEALQQVLGISRQETLDANIVKLAKRYPDFQYTDAHAHARADKI